jgi:hypothetical protein
MHVNISGSIANGPRPNGRKPKVHIINGLENRELSSKIIEKTISPTVNSD